MYLTQNVMSCEYAELKASQKDGIRFNLVSGVRSVPEQHAGPKTDSACSSGSAIVEWLVLESLIMYVEFVSNVKNYNFTVVTSSDSLKATFREKKGLHILLKIMISEKDVAIQQTAMFTLSCAIDSCGTNLILLLQIIIHRLISIGSSHYK